ncbi:hypothetical protein [Trichothermofontia sp.]
MEPPVSLPDLSTPSPEQTAPFVGILMQLTLLPEPQMVTQAREVIASVQQIPPNLPSTGEILEIGTTLAQKTWD